MKRQDRLSRIREKINQIDEKILQLILQRLNLAREVYRIKKANGMAVFDPARERDVLERIGAQVPDDLDEQAILKVFREIISLSRSVQKEEKVCYLGPEGTFSHMASIQFFGRTSSLFGVEDVEEVFQKVETGSADYGVVPVENSLQGTLGHVLDRLFTTSLSIIGEIYLRISLALLSHSSLDKIKVIYSHPHAIAQCRSWIRKNLPSAKIKEVTSTALAVKLAGEEKETGAVGSILAGEIYGVPVLAEDITEHKHNYTRFLVLSARPLKYAGKKSKTSVIFTLSHRPGSLFQALQGFARENINLTKIESRPLKESPWEYAFFVDFEGSLNLARVKRALNTLKNSSTFVKILGSYPAGEKDA